MNSQQPDWAACLPVIMKKFADSFIDLGVHLGGRRNRMGAGDSGEVGIAKLELQGPRAKAVLAQSAAYKFGKMGQRGLDFFQIASVFGVGVLVADGLGFPILAHFAFEPCACIFTTGFSG